MSKRKLDETDEPAKRMKHEVTEDDVNMVIASLQAPKISPKVATDYSNQRQAYTDVKAYAKLAGPNWTYYVQTTLVVLGRTSSPEEQVNIDLAPAKVVSRKHAAIKYVPEGPYWGVEILGRNGIKIDKVTYKQGVVPLKSGNVLDIGGVQMMFVLPGDPPQINPEMWPNNKMSYPKGVAIITRPQVRGVISECEQDLSKDEAKDIKPPYSYATMISQAILSTDEMMMSLADIYEWISSRYSFYRYSKSGWQNSIRHNLSLNKAFEKVPRKAHEPGKGMKWQISPAFKEEYIQRASNGGKIKKKKKDAPATTTKTPNRQSSVVSQLAFTPERGSSNPVPKTTPQSAPPSATFWKYMQFSTPLKEESPTKYDEQADLQNVDLTRGFRQIG